MSTIAKKLAEKIVAAAEDKKARDILIFDVEGISMVTDAFIICSAGNKAQVQAISDHIEEELGKDGIKILHKEGYREGRWILMDFGACVAHVFLEEERVFYNLERLWENNHSLREEA